MAHTLQLRKERLPKSVDARIRWVWSEDLGSHPSLAIHVWQRRFDLDPNSYAAKTLD